MVESKKEGSVFYRGPLKRVYPIMEKGEGIYLFDEKGKKYIDAKAGIAVVNVGYGLKEIVDKIANQAQELHYVFTVQFYERK